MALALRINDFLVGLFLGVGIRLIDFKLEFGRLYDEYDQMRIVLADEHIACFGWASQDEMNDIADMAIRVNDFMCGMFAAIGIRLVDFKLEFGRLYDGDFSRIILADEISPDGCRLWDMKSNEKLDKDRFRQDLGGVEEAYQEVARRLGLLPEEGEESSVLDLDSHRKKRGR